MVETDIKTQVLEHIKSLLLDESIQEYRDLEVFISKTDVSYEFLIWKTQPKDWNAFSSEIENLILKKGYEFVDGACDVSTYNIKEKTGYKVVALYKPE